MKVVWSDGDRGEVVIGDLDADRVGTEVALGVDLESLSRGGGADQLNDHLVAGERTTTPLRRPPVRPGALFDLPELCSGCGDVVVEDGVATQYEEIPRSSPGGDALRDRRGPLPVSVAAAVLKNRLDALLCRPAVRHHGNRTLLAHLRRERGVRFTFLEEPGIPATNWRAEQAIRGALSKYLTAS
ncbi:MAG: hypothetical protein QOE72_1454 [Chloroflexota bacterium]|nr:hypothetical protein [Chloroflexota bacterium]